MTAKSKNNKKKKRISLVNLALFILLVIMVAILVFWAGKVMLKNDRSDIKPKNFSELDLSSEPVTETPVENVDIAALTENFTYLSIGSDTLGSGKLGLYDTERQYSGQTDLAGVYESLFTPDGLQIASARSAKIKGDREMLGALSEMLNAFYGETGLRTIMIEQIFTEPEKEEETPVEEGWYDEYGNYIEPQTYETDEEETPLCYEHESGYAADFGLYIRQTGGFREFDGEGDYAWIYENAYKYGFVLRYPEGKEDITGMAYNPSHFRYVGEAAAAVMHEQDMCLEEFIEYIKDFGFDSPLTAHTASGCKVMYYIGDSGFETTDVQIPADSEGNVCPYEVSGNNVDGYIITVTPTEEFMESIGAEVSSGTDQTSDSKNT